MSGLSIIVPWRESAERVDAFRYVSGRLRTIFPSAEMVAADDPHPSFNRGRALNAGVRGATGSTLLFADADLWVPKGNLLAAVMMVAVKAPVVMPFTRLSALSSDATSLLLSLRPDRVVPAPDAIEYEWERRSSGGCNVVHRDVFDAVGGFDERFDGWGFEDAALHNAIATLVADYLYLEGQALHLWHPTDPTRGDDGHEARHALAVRYDEACGRPDVMRALIAEHDGRSA